MLLGIQKAILMCEDVCVLKKDIGLELQHKSEMKVSAEL